jgi:hypothetical protein
MIISTNMYSATLFNESSPRSGCSRSDRAAAVVGPLLVLKQTCDAGAGDSVSWAGHLGGLELGCQ